MANTSQGAYEFMVLQYDGNGLFRVARRDPGNRAGDRHDRRGRASVTGAFLRSALMRATVADNGNVVSSLNSPLSLFGRDLAVDDRCADGMDYWDRDRRQQDGFGAGQLHLRRAHSLPRQRRNTYFGLACQQQITSSSFCNSTAAISGSSRRHRQRPP